jgi:hypothetical protein
VAGLGEQRFDQVPQQAEPSTITAVSAGRRSRSSTVQRRSGLSARTGHDRNRET